MRDRGVSEVVSFVLVFSLIALTVGVVYVGGVETLQDARDSEQITNAERAFDVFDDNVNDITSQSAPNRGTEIKLADATLYFGNITRLNVTTEGGGTEEPYSVALVPIIYLADGETRLVYEAGAVFRTQANGGVRKSEPPVLFGTERTLIQFVQTRKQADSPVSVSGDQTVLVRTTGAGKKVLAARTDGPYKVTYNVTTERTKLWHSFLEGRIKETGVKLDGEPGDYDDNPCQIHGRTVVCKFETERLYVTVTRIDVAFN